MEMINNFCMNHFVPCQSYLAVKEPFERSEQRALVGHSTFLGTTHGIFFGEAAPVAVYYFGHCLAM